MLDGGGGDLCLKNEDKRFAKKKRDGGVGGVKQSNEIN